MRIKIRISVAMMVAMVRRPPQRTALHAGGAKQGKRELCAARSPEGSVREVAVIEPRQREHPDRVQRGGNHERDWGYPDPKHTKAAEMQRDEWRRTQPVDTVRAWIIRFSVPCFASIEPLAKTRTMRRLAHCWSCGPARDGQRCQGWINLNGLPTCHVRTLSCQQTYTLQTMVRMHGPRPMPVVAAECATVTKAVHMDGARTLIAGTLLRSR